LAVSPLYRLIAAECALLLTSQAVYLALVSQLVLKKDGSALALLGITAALRLPTLILAPAAGAFIDRWGTVKSLPALTLVRSFIILGLAMWWRIPFLCFFLLSILALIDNLIAVSRKAFLPRLVDDSGLARANGLFLRGAVAAGVAGPWLVGTLVTRMDERIWLVCVGCLCALVTALVTGLPQSASRPLHNRDAFVSLRDGIRLLTENSAVLSAVTALSIYMTGAGLANFATPLLYKERGLNAESYGLVLSSFAVGQFVGTFLIQRLDRKGDQFPFMLLFSAYGACLVLLPAFSFTLLFAALFLIMGMCSALIQIWFDAFLQERTQEAYRGRTLSLCVSICGGAFLCASGLGALMAQIGVTFVLMGASVCMLAGGMAARRKLGGHMSLWKTVR